jgi:hypothetical protein
LLLVYWNLILIFCTFFDKNLLKFRIKNSNDETVMDIASNEKIRKMLEDYAAKKAELTVNLLLFMVMCR